jgi:hypothetical protein
MRGSFSRSFRIGVTSERKFQSDDCLQMHCTMRARLRRAAFFICYGTVT